MMDAQAPVDPRLRFGVNRLSGFHGLGIRGVWLLSVLSVLMDSVFVVKGEAESD
jgi:hypothetical protein